jgi:hypothetical protein
MKNREGAKNAKNKRKEFDFSFAGVLRQMKNQMVFLANFASWRFGS